MTLEDVISGYEETDPGWEVFWDDTRPRSEPPTQEDIERAEAKGWRFSCCDPTLNSRSREQLVTQKGRIIRGTKRITLERLGQYTAWRLETPDGDPVAWGALNADT